MLKYLIFLLLAPQLVNAQKLVIDPVDPRTNKIVKETDWMKLRGTDKTRLMMKCKRIGEEVKLYLRQNVKGYDGPASYNNSYVLLALDNNDTLKIQMFALNEISYIGPDFVFAADLQNIKAQPTDEPFGLSTHPLSQEQLKLLQQHDIKWVSIYFYENKNDIGIKEKDKDSLKEYAALVN